MHPGAFEFVGRYATTEHLRIVEIGSRDINGSVRSHFPGAQWIGLDLYPGPGVDIVADALDHMFVEQCDMIVCCEVFEHCSYWGEMLNHVSAWLKPGGKIIITCAGPGRDVHSAIDGGEVHPDEHYSNVTQDQLAEELHYAGFQQIEVSGNEYWKDTYAVAMKAPS